MEENKETFKELLDSKMKKVNRFEIINHASNDKPIGRILSMHEELDDFKSIQLDFQDGGRTLKIFIG